MRGRIDGKGLLLLLKRGSEKGFKLRSMMGGKDLTTMGFPESPRVQPQTANDASRSDAQHTKRWAVGDSSGQLAVGGAGRR
jgi:hypothetical protein